MHYIYFFFLAFAIVIISANVLGFISYGHGLGDMGYSLLVLISTLLIGAIKLIANDFTENTLLIDALLLPVSTLLLISFCLKFTIYRGGESSWNGKIFLHNDFRDHVQAKQQEYLCQLEALTNAIHTDPNNAELYYQRGLLRRKHGELKHSAEDYKQALALNPDLKEARQGMEYNEWMLDVFEEWLRKVEKELKNNPKSKKVKQEYKFIKAQVEKLRKNS